MTLKKNFYIHILNTLLTSLFVFSIFDNEKISVTETIHNTSKTTNTTTKKNKYTY